MAALTTALATAFTPAAGDFIVQCAVGVAELQRENATGAGWTSVGIVTGNDAPIVSNPVAGARYQFIQVGATTAYVRADQ